MAFTPIHPPFHLEPDYNGAYTELMYFINLKKLFIVGLIPIQLFLCQFIFLDKFAQI